MASNMEHYLELWDAKRKEYEAKGEKLSAEKRMEFNSALDDFGAEVAAAQDWTEASWKEFSAKVEQKWHSYQIEHGEDESNG